MLVTTHEHGEGLASLGERDNLIPRGDLVDEVAERPSGVLDTDEPFHHDLPLNRKVHPTGSVHHSVLVAPSGSPLGPRGNVQSDCLLLVPCRGRQILQTAL